MGDTNATEQLNAPLPEDLSRLRVVLSHDWLTGMRGGERVLELLCGAYPNAPILTLIRNRSAVSDAINRHPVTTSWLQRLPGVARYYRNLLPLFPMAAAGLRPGRADLLISTSHCVAKAVRPPPGTRHLCVCFTPMRYAWTFHDEYFGRNPLKRMLVGPMLAALRRWDARVSDRVHRFVAISRHVQERIRRCYGRDSDVVYPPVDTGRWTPGVGAPGEFDLIVSALVPYKRIDLAVAAYARMSRTLKIVGIGGDAARLRRLAPPNVEFLGWLPDEQLLPYYRGCRMLLFPGEEDFGLVPLEAQACGRPVVAFGRGGALETVEDGVSGVFFREQTAAALADAVQRSLATPWDTARIRAHAERFSVAAFWQGMEASIRQCLRPDVCA